MNPGCDLQHCCFRQVELTTIIQSRHLDSGGATFNTEMATMDAWWQYNEELTKKLESGEITEDDASEMEKKWVAENGDDINAPPCPYPLRPEHQGKLVLITGAPGSGTSRTAQLLARNKGGVLVKYDSKLYQSL